ncbi:hypothetical protein [Bowmanella sp. JS7-9]|uniref:Uncharacterized protein n=1 Tax=Pseudobowmanella zhangzhouensis TaxID=1537679 RepID=A0ABW1XP32_9ALTE|nr:hypothetical protein [Bowmanella sp. JS7-9]TBX21904.1 hypothetical protein TK45_10450 [Bowmanella sp. JS7-9]
MGKQTQLPGFFSAVKATFEIASFLLGVWWFYAFAALTLLLLVYGTVVIAYSVIAITIVWFCWWFYGHLFVYMGQSIWRMLTGQKTKAH